MLVFIERAKSARPTLMVVVLAVNWGETRIGAAAIAGLSAGVLAAAG